MHCVKYPREHVHVLLNQFDKAIKNKQYTERIPYNAWKNITESKEMIVEVEEGIVRVYGYKRADIAKTPNEDECVWFDKAENENLTLLYSDKIYNWGFGLHDKLGITASVLVGALIFIVQLAFCRWWMRHHSHGPMEYLWKRATWLK